MPDNPRIPGHPSDMPSSRTPEGNNKSVPPPAYTPPPAAAHVKSGSNQTKNIIIGAIVTVISSTLIYYLTVYQNRSGSGGDFKSVREATVNAWKSYLAYENAYTRNMLSLEKSSIGVTGNDGYIQGMRNESAKFTKDLTDLAATKGYDKDLVKAFNRRLENEKTALQKAEEYFNNVLKIQQGKGTDRQKLEAYLAEEMRWNIYAKGAYERSVNDIEEIARILNQRYAESFNLNDFLMVQLQPQRFHTADSLLYILEQTVLDSSGRSDQKTDPEGYEFLTNLNPLYIQGAWKAQNGALFNFQAGGQAVITMPSGDKAIGSWKIETGKLRMDAVIQKNKRSVTWRFNLSRVYKDSLTITNEVAPYDSYKLKKDE